MSAVADRPHGAPFTITSEDEINNVLEAKDGKLPKAIAKFNEEDQAWSQRALNDTGKISAPMGEHQGKFELTQLWATLITMKSGAESLQTVAGNRLPSALEKTHLFAMSKTYCSVDLEPDGLASFRLVAIGVMTVMCMPAAEVRRFFQARAKKPVTKALVIGWLENITEATLRLMQDANVPMVRFAIKKGGIFYAPGGWFIMTMVTERVVGIRKAVLPQWPKAHVDANYAAVRAMSADSPAYQTITDRIVAIAAV